MIEREFFEWLLFLLFMISPIIAIILFCMPAPYGRHFRQGWEPVLNFKIGWVIMESAAIISFAIAFFYGERSSQLVPLIFFMLWQIHYVDRTFFYPLRQPAVKKKMTISILISGVLFNLTNGFLNGSYLSTFGPAYSLAWIWDIRFIVGVILFASGFLINRYSDALLLRLRKPGETDYKIPKGMLFDYISCPNYFGEVVQWFGWAIATWSLPGLAFALFTVCNLVPRAYWHHRWYRSHFSSYPQNRKVIIPFIF